MIPPKTLKNPVQVPLYIMSKSQIINPAPQIKTTTNKQMIKQDDNFLYDVTVEGNFYRQSVVS